MSSLSQVTTCPDACQKTPSGFLPGFAQPKIMTLDLVLFAFLYVQVLNEVQSIVSEVVSH